MQQEVAKFKNKVLDIYKSHLAVLNSLPSDIEEEEKVSAPVVEEPEAVAEPVQPVVEKVEEVQEAVAAAEEAAEAEVAATEEKEDELKFDDFSSTLTFPEEKPAEERKSRFGNLDFGDKFDFGK